MKTPAQFPTYTTHATPTQLENRSRVAATIIADVAEWRANLYDTRGALLDTQAAFERTSGIVPAYLTAQIADVSESIRLSEVTA